LKAALCRLRFAFIGLLFIIYSKPAKIETYLWSKIRGPPLTDVFFNYFDEIDLQQTLKDLSAALTLVMPINQEADSIDQLQRATDKLETVCSYVVLRNTVHSENFPLFDKTVIRKRLLRELGGKEITMSKLQPWLVEELSHKNLTATTAVAGGDTHLLDRRRLQTWQRKFYGQIESVADLLLPIKS
jgi:hypothetical protein